MKKIGIILIPLLLASCTEQEVLTPVEPTTPDGNVLIVPSLSMEVSGDNGATPWNNPASGMGDTHATTRATTTYPYVIADATGKKTIVVLKDKNGTLSNSIHPRWQETPEHNPYTVLQGSFLIYSSFAPILEVAQTVTGPVEWGSTNANCTAPWRRPTISEMWNIYKVHTQLELKEPFNTESNYFYATATTGVDPSKGYSTRFDNGTHEPAKPKTDKILVRCVRDAYPYVTTNAEGKASVIVARDEYGMAFGPLHSPWTMTPAHVETAPQNSVSYQFEVAKEDVGSKVGTSLSTGTCTSPYRLPTEREMMLIVNLRDQLSGITPLTLSNTGTTPSTYWSFTKYSGDATHYWYTEQNTKVGTTDHAANTESANVRCVRDVFDSFSDVVGQEVAALWGYPSPNAGTPLIRDAKIKRTATGFELSPPQYYPADGNQKLYFYAYAPTDMYSGNYGTGIVSHRLKGQTDVLWAKDDRGIAKNSNPAQQEQPFFRFRHQLMQLKFKFVADTSYESGKAVTNITAKGVNNIIDTNIIDGSATFRSVDNSNKAQPDFSSTLAINPTDYNVVITGILLRETLLIEPRPTVTLSITVGGVTYPDITIALKGTNPGTAGKSHLITLTLKRNLIVPTASMVDWTTGGSADVGAI